MLVKSSVLSVTGSALVRADILADIVGSATAPVPIWVLCKLSDVSAGRLGRAAARAVTPAARMRLVLKSSVVSAVSLGSTAARAFMPSSVMELSFKSNDVSVTGSTWAIAVMPALPMLQHAKLSVVSAGKLDSAAAKAVAPVQ